MPYRRLPNTDEARLRALRTAFQKAKELNPFQLAFTQSTYNQIQSFLPLFEKVIYEHRFNYSTHITRSKDYQQQFKKARLFVSHFIQVMNMAVERGDLPTSTRLFYGLEENQNKLPNLLKEKDLIIWGERIIKGEADRSKQGLTPIANPTIGKVKVWYDKFIQAQHSQKTGQKTTTRYIDEMSDLRKKADDIIVKIWDEVEAKYNALPDHEKREEATKYGVNYVFRKNELERIKFPEAVQMAMSL